MKKRVISLGVVALILLLGQVVIAEEIAYPPEKSVFTISLPDGYTPKWSEDMLNAMKGKEVLGVNILGIGTPNQEMSTKELLAVAEISGLSAAQGLGGMEELAKETFEVNKITYFTTYYKGTLNNMNVTMAIINFSPDNIHVYQIQHLYDVLTHQRSLELISMLRSIKLLKAKK